MNNNSKNNVYEQIKNEIIKYIQLGIYKENEKLPSCRSLALDLGVNPITVEKAYQSLADEKIIEIIPKKGVYVKCSHIKVHNEINLKEVIINLKNNDIKYDDILKVLDEVYYDKN